MTARCVAERRRDAQRFGSDVAYCVVVVGDGSGFTSGSEGGHVVTLSRRKFLTTVGVAGGSVAISGVVPSWARSAWAPGAGALGAGELKALTDFVLSEARRLGCPYGDVAIIVPPAGSRTRRAALASQGIPSLSPAFDGGSLICRVRVEHSKGSGMAEGRSVRKDDMARTLVRAIADARANAPRGDRASKAPPRRAQQSPMTFSGEETYFVSSRGTRMQSAAFVVG